MQKAIRIYALLLKSLCLAAPVAVASISFASSAQEAVQDTESRAVPVVPQQVRYGGKLATRAGETVEAVFRIYPAAEGGDPIWTETQRVVISEDGSYSVLLGSANSNGLPQAVFAGGAARWLGISTDQSPEQERVLLSSVPYAMKSADAESLAGHAASDFVTQEQFAELAQSAQVSAHAGQTGGGSLSLTPLTSGTVTGSGTAGAVPLWTGTLTQGNSVITQVGSDVGINEATPGATLDVGGTANFRGTATLPAESTATTSAGYRSQLLDFTDSAWSTTTKAPVAQTWRLYATDSGNDSANPTSSFNFQFQNGAGALTPTVLSIAQTGVITFAPTQTFPGTITSVSATSPLSEVSSSGNVSLGLNTNALVTDITPSLESSFNSVYAQLGKSNTFTGELEAQGSTGFPALEGEGTNSTTGVLGQSDSGYGVSGISTTGTGIYGTSIGTGYAGYFINNTVSSPAIWAENDAAGNPGLGIAVKAIVSSAHAIGVLGKALSDESYGVFGEDLGGTDSYGVYANATGAGSTAIYGISTGGADANNVIGSGVVGVSTSGNGVEGRTLGASVTGANEAPNGSWGMWGDIGPGSANVGAAILGTADNFYAAYLENNGYSPTIFAYNSGDGQAATFNSYSNYQASPTVNVTNSSNGGAGEMVNTSNYAVTLYLSNNGSDGIIDQVAKAKTPANDALFKTLMASTPTGTCGIGGNGDLSCTGQMKSLVSTNDGARKVETYATQSAENWMEDYGTGVMERGVSVVKIDPAFAETISQTADYHVFITPRADSKGLYVINATPSSFEVRESGGGTSSLTFDYKIVAKRSGYERQRLTDVTERFKSEVARAKPVKLDGHKSQERNLTAAKTHATTYMAPSIQP